ncbi:MAG: hypothetical protein JW749_08545 [Sedimentisphaerales bacterium]|nr:hypothetical protein [Sedimentisphaerales bacterium]
MKKALMISVLLVFACGCHSDIVTTKQFKLIKEKFVYIHPIDCEDPFVGRVLRDVLEKEFIRKKVRFSDANTANVIITGSTFLTVRSAGKTGWFGSKEASAQAIESVAITAKDRQGNVLLTASYDNSEQLTASKLAKEFGSTLAYKLR